MAELSWLMPAIAAYVFPALMLAAGAGDVLTMRIPNWLTALIAVAFLPLAAGSGMTVTLIGQHLMAGAALLAFGFLLFSVGFIGGGDAKLMAAAGLWFGYPGLVAFLIYTALAGGVLAVAVGLCFLIRWHAEIWGLTRGAPSKALSPDVPYGLALAAGALLAAPGAWWAPGWSP